MTEFLFSRHIAVSFGEMPERNERELKEIFASVPTIASGAF
ncbi:hypothetical protein [Ensifer sp. SL37]|nr:hypothetical protein [Ensifer sp. SL37]MCY1741051.1 hypothetical protein [Ensifer sp. SL37]